MTIREKAIMQLRKSISIEPNEYTEMRIQKLIALWRSKNKRKRKEKYAFSADCVIACVEEK